MSSATLSVRNASKHFGGVIAVEDVSFDAVQGCVLGIIGQNGAGKTTLFNLIAGHLHVTKGTISVRDVDVSKLPAWRRSHLGVARTFQVPQPIWGLSVLDNVCVGLVAHGVHLVEARERANVSLAELGLATRRDVMPSDLSPGQLRLLEFARAAALNPTILLLDEVFAGLSSAERDQSTDIVRKLANSGIAIIWIEHNVSLMMKLADSVLVMDKGSVVTHGSPAEIAADQRVIDIYLGSGRRRAPSCSA